MHRDTEAADAMLGAAQRLLRLTLDRVGTQQVPLKEELDFLQKYLEIERTRFGDRLQVHVRRRARHARRRGAEPRCCSRSSRTRCATASRRRSAAAAWRSRARRDGERLLLVVATTAAACRTTSSTRSTPASG